MIRSISMNMKFWHDGQDDSTRLRNVKFCWPKLKELAIFLSSETEIITDSFLFDFSPEQIIEDSIHIPYPLGTYKISEKTNLMMKQQASYDMFMMVDSDAFFDQADYILLKNLWNEMTDKDVITFDLAKISDIQRCIKDNGSFDRSDAVWSYAYSGDMSNGPLKGYYGGLGGVYIINPKTALSLGGFDEKYVGWGGEDGDMFGRLMYSGQGLQIKPQNSFAPFHLPHFCDFSNPLYSNRFAE